MSRIRVADGVPESCTGDGPLRFDGENWHACGHREPWPDDETAVGIVLPGGLEACCAATDAAGHVWVGTREGLWVGRSGGWLPVGGSDGLPVEDVRAVALAADGAVWLALRRGVARLHEGRWRYYAGRRWLPDDRVHAVAPDADGGAWVATEGGVAHIERRPMTLPDKAAHYQAVTEARHVRRGYVAECELRVPGDTASARPIATDNDGLWTALYVVAQCFRYAVTGDASARDAARAGMEALLLLLDVTGIPGFPARAVAHRDEDCSGYDLDDPNWQHTNPAYPGLIWKGDTSSDEIDGHYLAWLVYHELVASPDERLRIVEACRAVTDHIIAHGYYLVGPSGAPTTWGVWAPEKLNGDPSWSDEHGLNALEILAHLKVACHLCGDAVFERAYRDLVEAHHYALNTVDQKVLPPRGSDNHSDDELAWCAYYPLLVLESDATLRRLYLWSLERTQQVLAPQRSPFHSVLYGALTGRPCGAEDAVQWLRECPLDLVEWTMQNSHRADVDVDPADGRHGERQSRRVLSIAERPLHKWNGNPYTLDGGADGRLELDGTLWLLPYWMARFHRIID